jgi:Tol biopolymer transport system component
MKAIQRQKPWVWILLALAALIVLPVLVLGLGVPTHVWVPGTSSTPASSTTPGLSGATTQPSNADLEAVLEAPASLPRGEPVEVRFTLTNRSETGLYVLKWYTPLEGLYGDIFRVERDGEPIPYNGPLVMRGDPTGDDYVYLDPGESASATVDLTAVGENDAPAYDFSRPGRYTIVFISPRISHVAPSVSTMARSVEDLHPVQMSSEPITVEISAPSASADRRTLTDAEEMIREYLRNSRPSLSPDFPMSVQEVPAHDVWERLRVQIFWVTEGPFDRETFLIHGSTVLRLGTAVGGQGVNSLTVSDLDRDSAAELLFAYSFGAGIHQSRFGMFAPTYDPNRIYEADSVYLGAVGLVKEDPNEDMAHVAVRVVEPDDDTKTLRYQERLGQLTIRQGEDQVELVLEVAEDLPDDVRENLVQAPAPTDTESAPDPPSAGLIYATAGGLWGIAADGSPIPLIDQPGAQISPDGRQALFSAGRDTEGSSDIWLADLETGERHNLTNTPDRDEVNPVWWHGRSELILFGSGVGMNMLDTGYPTVVRTDGSDYEVLDTAQGGPFAPSPDGRMVAYGGYDDVGAIYRWDAGPEPFEPARYGLSVEKLYQPAWHPDGRRLAWKVGGDLTGEGKRQIGIALFDLEAETAGLFHPYEPVGGTFDTDLAWSPNGEWLAFVTHQEPPAEGRLPNLWVVRWRDGEETYVGAGIDPTWSPDGRHLAYTDVQGERAFLAIAEVGTWQVRQVDLPYDIDSVSGWVPPSLLTK